MTNRDSETAQACRSDRMREAAALMRERAEAWADFQSASERMNWDAVVPFPMKPTPAALHGNAWTPAVALAVADWLEAESQSHIHVPGSDRTRAVYDMPGMDTAPAMLVALAYLGSKP